MIRQLLATTALAAILATTGALAQDASSSSMMDPSMSSMPMDSSMMSSAPMESSMMDASAMSSQMSDASTMDSSMMSSAPMDTMSSMQPRTPISITSGYSQVDTDQLATKIIGQPVYDGTDANADNLGNISDLVLNGNGDVAAVVIGVGGFLGIGQKQVAVDFSALQLVVAADNTKRFVVQTSKDELTNAPDFKTVDTTPSQAASDMSMSASGTMSSSAMSGDTSSSSAAQ